MKIIKKYEYVLSEKTLEKDIDRFIRDVKKGYYLWDGKSNDKDGIKIIRAYFRMIEEEFKKQNYANAKNCYKKLMFPLLQCDYDYFNMDIIGTLNFEKFIENYFTCLIKICNVEELFKEYIEYLNAKKEYDFDIVHQIILLNLTEIDLIKYEKLVEENAEKVNKKQYYLYDLIYFLLDLAKYNRNKEEYDKICQKYVDFVGEEQKEEYNEVN